MTKPLARLDIVEIEDTLAAHALRGALECWDVQVRMHWVGMARDVVRLLGGEEKLYEIVVLMCHGNDKGLVLPALHPSIERRQPYHRALTPKDLEEFPKTAWADRTQHRLLPGHGKVRTLLSRRRLQSLHRRHRRPGRQLRVVLCHALVL